MVLFVVLFLWKKRSSRGVQARWGRAVGSKTADCLVSRVASCSRGQSSVKAATSWMLQKSSHPWVMRTLRNRTSSFAGSRVTVTVSIWRRPSVSGSLVGSLESIFQLDGTLRSEETENSTHCTLVDLSLIRSIATASVSRIINSCGNWPVVIQKVLGFLQSETWIALCVSPRPGTPAALPNTRLPQSERQIGHDSAQGSTHPSMARSGPCSLSKLVGAIASAPSASAAALRPIACSARAGRRSARRTFACRVRHARWR
mmetsp:Transcript_13208/g.33721  ORF Transcript_13208/g.33721 Transcript_13208/m.33721 type:complete len:258 (+) Transcript_13208:30-803(+)